MGGNPVRIRAGARLIWGPTPTCRTLKGLQLIFPHVRGYFGILLWVPRRARSKGCGDVLEWNKLREAAPTFTGRILPLRLLALRMP